MSLRFIAAQVQYLQVERAVVTTPPFTISAWIHAASPATDNPILAIIDPAVSTHYFRFRFTNTPRVYVHARAGGVDATAFTQGGLFLPGWNHVAGVWRTSAYGNPARIAYGAGTKGTDNSVIQPSNLSRTTLGAFQSAGAYANAKIGHVALWNTVLADDEIKLLSAGACPYDIKREFLILYEPLAITGRFPLDKRGGFTPFGTTFPQYDSDPPVNTHSTSKYIIVPTGAALKGRITAADAEITYSTIKGKVTAVDAEATYTTIKGQITAADAEITYNERKGKITAADAEITYDTVKGKITASDAEITYSTVIGKITAVDAEITYTETGVPTGKITAADIEITYDPVKAQITAVDGEVTYDTVKGKITAADAEITYDERKGKITAADAEITYDPVTGRITATDAEVTYDPVAGRITAADAEITYNERKAKVTAVDAEITYTVVPTGESARITACDIEITFTTVPGPGWNWDALRKVPDIWSAPAFPYGIVLQPSPSPPIASQDRIMIGGHMSRWHGQNPFSKPGKISPWDPLPLFGLIWYTWNQSNPADFSTAQVQSSYFEPGYNYDEFKQALVRRIENRGGIVADEIIEAGGLVQLRGQAIIDIASMLDVVYFGHWIPGLHAQMIKERSTATGATKIFLWSDFESIQQKDFWVTSQNPYKQYLVTKPLASTGGFNAYGCTIIDKYESSPWDLTKVGCPHTPKHDSLIWPPTVDSAHGLDIDIYDHTGNAVYTSVNTFTVLSAYNYCIGLDNRIQAGNWYVDGIAFDNLLDNPYKGTSTLNYEATWTAERYRNSWKAFLDGWQHWNPSFGNPYPSATDSYWANGMAACDIYTAQNIKQRYLERFFAIWVGYFRAKTKTEIFADLALVEANGTRIVLGVGAGGFDMGDTYYWATTPGGINQSVNGTWLEIATEAKTLGITNQIYAPAIQTFGTGSFMMLQDVMRRPS